MNWFRRLLFGDPPMVIEHWSEDRAKRYEKATYRYWGIRPDPIYPWSRKYRPKVKSTVLQMAERKRA